MINKIIDDIKIITYGRETKGKEWTITPKIGVNRIYYVHEGSGMLYNNGNIKLEKGFVYLFPQSMEFNPIADDGKFVDHTFFDFYLPAYASKNVIKLKKEHSPLIKSTVDSLIEIADKKPMYKILKRNEFYDAAIALIACLMFFISKCAKDAEFVTDFRILNALNYIKHNFNKPISSKELAKSSGLDETYFIKLFKEQMNISPYQYIKNYRLNTAISLLKSGYSVSDAAYTVGYESLGSFTNSVKEYTGCLPSELKYK